MTFIFGKEELGRLRARVDELKKVIKELKKESEDSIHNRKSTNTITPKPMSQNTQILNYLKEGNSITPIEALSKFGCFRLASRCHDLRDLGHDIKTKTVTKEGKSFAQYSLNGN